ncbi:MAG TPA: LacI family DNA-binding transcriptional regulator [Ignavibacteriaceae bacterium]|nr:LacI family DNA-binding transcriptional regulator [Ignavibacteriaceae bacterium]
MAITIKDVAKEAEVSIATVSLVIHNHKRISPETKLKVNRIIKELNYHPSRSARGLVFQKTGNIGFILTEDHFLRSEPFYTRVFIGTEFQARQYEYYILFTTISSTFQVGDKLPRFILERNVDGIIIAGKVPSAILDGLNKYNLPIAFADYYPPEGNYPVVMIDNISGGILAVQHLIGLKHKKIAFIGGDIEHPSIWDRFQGYKSGIEKSGIKFNPDYCITDTDCPNRENGYSSAKKLLEKSPDITAIFACNDAMAIGVMQYLKEKECSIPEDISLIGFDDVEADLSLDPPLSTIGVPKAELGIEAMRLMSDMLNNSITSPKKILVPVELVQRRSTGPANNDHL